MEATGKVSTKGQVVIPAELRKRHHLGPGAQVRIFEYGDLVCITPVVKEPVEAAYGFLADGGRPLTEELLEERRKDNRGE